MTVQNTYWGASQADWDLFENKLRLKDDLLPVVSNPNVPIAERSELKTEHLGKTPSRVHKGKAVGILGWTRRQASDNDLNRWKSNSDHGICVQTRVVRAIDIDVADPIVATRVRDVVELVLEMQLPRRWRPDSGKCLLAFRMPGTFAKRVLRTAHGIVEFLGNGQQFVAAGTHVKGQRYEWKWPNPSAPELPELTQDEFEALWRALADAFAVEPPTTGRGAGQRPLVPRRAGVASDPETDHVIATGWALSATGDGRLNVRCPWEGDHTPGSDDTATQWFPAGVGGIYPGHFRCLHAHCEHRTRSDFLKAIGYEEDLADSFEVVEAAPGDPVELPKPIYQRKRTGVVLGSLANAELALQRPDLSGMHVAYDSFLDALMCAPYAPGVGPHEVQWRAFTDNDYTALRLHLERRQGFEPVGRETIKDAVHWAAERNRIDSAIEWLTHRVPAWDGVPRVDSFLPRYFKTADTPYTRACGAYLWTALAGRVLEPGVQADMVLVLIGRQGTGKTSGVQALVPCEDHFAELSLGSKDEELARRMRGILVGELGELRGLSSREGEAIKQWVSRRFEHWVPKFKEFATRYGRRCVLIGTTNREEFLADEEGEERRWLPARVGITDIEALRRDREQLWAEGRERFLAGGVEWRAAQELARGVHGEHRVTDAWTEPVAAWLAMGEMDDPAHPRGLSKRGVVASEVFTGALSVPAGRATRGDEMRLGKVLRELGFERKVAWIDGRAAKRWFATEECDFLHARNDTIDLA